MSRLDDSLRLSLSRVFAEPTRPTEKVEQSLCDKAVRGLGGKVRSLSQVRPSRVEIGLPDRRYIALGTAFWWETKAWNGQLTTKQTEFLLDEIAAGELAGCGTSDDFTKYLLKLREVQMEGRPLFVALTSIAHRLVARWRLTEPQRRALVRVEGWRPERCPCGKTLPLATVRGRKQLLFIEEVLPPDDGSKSIEEVLPPDDGSKSIVFAVPHYLHCPFTPIPSNARK